MQLRVCLKDCGADLDDCDVNLLSLVHNYRYYFILWIHFRDFINVSELYGMKSVESFFFVVLLFPLGKLWYLLVLRGLGLFFQNTCWDS